RWAAAARGLPDGVRSAAHRRGAADPRGRLRARRRASRAPCRYRARRSRALRRVTIRRATLGGHCEMRPILRTRPGLRGKTALVTGAGRRRGLGFAISARLAAEGARVVLSDLEGMAAELQERVADLQARGAEAAVVCADVTSEREVDGLFARTLET